MKLLIANRGEIAVRIEKAARSLGWEIQRVHAANEAPPTPDSRPLASSGPSAYLDHQALVTTGIETGCTHVHPGYGFVSENSEFARACDAAGITFVGPGADFLHLFGDKAAARAHAESRSVPVLSATGPDASLEEVSDLLNHHPSGIMIKATAGGGGRGMRQVIDADHLADAYRACRSEAKRAFGIDTVYAERLVGRAKHIEIQLLADGTGAVTSLGERECSVQRRHQKLIEFAPSPSLNDSQREVLAAAARSLLIDTAYRGLATVEFLVDAGSLTSSEMDYCFIEVNPRIQVEHTITEEVTGVDLVASHLKIAAGATLTDLGFKDVVTTQPGLWSIQCRLNAEKVVGATTIATTGTVEQLNFPAGVRVDTYLEPGLVVDGSFDSLMAKVITRTEGTWHEACAEARKALSASNVIGVETNHDFLDDLLADERVTHGSITTGDVDVLLSERADDSAGATDRVEASFAGTVVEVNATEGLNIAPGQPIITLEAMKMEHVLAAPAPVLVTAIHVAPGDIVAPGDLLASLAPADGPVTTDDQADQVDLDLIRADLAELHERKRLTLDEARPEAVARRHARGHLMAREWIAQLADEGSFVEYGSFPVAAQRTRRDLDDLIANTPADGIITGLATVEDRAVAILAYDYTVLAGTQGYFNHKKTDRLLQVAKAKKTPVVFFAEGGGGRPGDTDTQLLLAAGLNVETFAMMGSLSGVVPTVGILTGRCFAGNAALLGACDVIIATADANVGMAGPAMIEGGGLGSYRPEDIGPMDVQSANGVVDIVVDDDAAAIDAATQYLSYFGSSASDWSAADQRALRHVIGENRKRVYDPHALIELLADDNSVLELRSGFGAGIITALVRIAGRPMGLVANNPAHLGGAIDADAADKMARFWQLCDAHGLPIISLCDTPGFMVGPEAEQQASVRHFGRLFVIGSHLRVPMLTVIVRKGYGLGAQAMAGGSFASPLATVAWPTGEIGGMGLEGAVRLGYAKELDAIEDPTQREARYQELLDAHYETGKAISGAMKHEFDEVIDPVDTRTWITAVLGDWLPEDHASSRYVDGW